MRWLSLGFVSLSCFTPELLSSQIGLGVYVWVYIILLCKKNIPR